MSILKNIKNKSKKLMQELIVLHLAYKNPKTPWTAKALIVLIIGYALSPIDLIPDFIPVIGLLDDLILLPLVIYWAIKLIPKDILEECRVKAKTHQWNKRKSWTAAIIIAIIWILIVYFIIHALFLNK
ncbi:YkvA family protein [Gelidibacter salicanalis]|uniref:DUF1232 domain-containing protein n=1 Tax=Gelidibacter salicanalis TaxID=291193 RepID=A0A934KND4_9FLAO|nr:DUF1232 domain-containing protein [Gelidibacter salicanalis]MBJ7882531.1 DUF1232 domain-containing protein [Gelidibacter salicanalis]